MSERRQHRPEPPPLQCDPLPIVTLRTELVAELEVLVLQPAQGGARRLTRLVAVYRVIPPLPSCLLQALVEDLCEILIAVEFLFVLDADEGTCVLGGRHLERRPRLHARQPQLRLAI